jgi:renalase
VKKTVAIIGAGISGLSCAQALRAAGATVRVFEQTSGVGGRCATRLWQGHLVDLGVQYFTAQSPEFKKELLTRLRQFRPIISPVLDRENNPISSSTGPRFYVLQGNNYLAHVLSAGLDVQLNTTVESLTFGAAGIDCLGETYHAVVSALPAPITARLFSLARASVEYEPSLTALLEYATANLSRDCYARLLPEGKTPIASSYCENHKAGRIIGTKTVFVVQASQYFSRTNADAPPETYLPLLVKENEDLWQISSSNECTARYGHTWPYGHPISQQRHQVDLPKGGFTCGDSYTESTVEDVWLNGRKVAADVLTYLGRNGS